MSGLEGSAAHKLGGVAFPADAETASAPAASAICVGPLATASDRRSTPPRANPAPIQSRSARGPIQRGHRGQQLRNSLGRCSPPACRSRFIAGASWQKRCDARPPRIGQVGHVTVGGNMQQGLVKIRLRAFEPRRLVFVPLVLFDILFDLALLSCIAAQPPTDTGGATSAPRL